MNYLTLEELAELHRAVIAQSGGSDGIRDMGALESAARQPMAGLGGSEFYPTIVEKASALAYSIIKNHPCMDGNKRLGNTAVETFLSMNGYEIRASVDDRERAILGVADGNLSRDGFTDWLRTHIVPALPEAQP